MNGTPKISAITTTQGRCLGWGNDLYLSGFIGFICQTENQGPLILDLRDINPSSWGNQSGYFPSFFIRFLYPQEP